MAKLNRGNTLKLSVRLSATAEQKIRIAAKNLGISAGGLILFELTKLLKDFPAADQIEDMKEEITLERKHFVVTVNERLMQQIDNLAARYDMKKNILIGYVVSDHFLKAADPEAADDLDPKKLMVQVNESLKKKMMNYSEKHFIPLSGLVTYSILQGPYEGMPSYEDGEAVQFFTNVPGYIGDMVKERAEEANIREHFYTALCLYKQFMTPGGRFFELEKER